MRRIARRSFMLFAGMGGFALLIGFVLLACASVETSAHGVPTRLLVPVVVGDIAFPITVANGAPVSMPGFLDGPVVRRHSGGEWSATWFCQDHADSARGSGETVRIECAGKTHSFALQEADVPAAVGPMPSRVAVLSDLEGNVVFLDAALRKLAITDAVGSWRYGKGHLVILGDSVDRGRDVFAVLWRLHALAAQADAAGGAVHVLLGNHDQYMLRTNPARANHEHLYALNAMGGYRQAFADDTVIGHWLRQQPVLLKLGPVLFAHGGVSPEVARSGLSIEQLNAAMRAYWQAPPTTRGRSAAYDAVLAQTGVTQYRGYFRASEGTYPLASDADVQLGLDHFDASEIVVAHTIVDEVASLRDGRVRAVDVNSDESRPQVLTYENGIARVVDIGIRRNLPVDDVMTFQDFDLVDPGDRTLLVAMYKDFRRLSALPYPY